MKRRAPGLVEFAFMAGMLVIACGCAGLAASLELLPVACVAAGTAVGVDHLLDGGDRGDE